MKVEINGKEIEATSASYSLNYPIEDDRLVSNVKPLVMSGSFDVEIDEDFYEYISDITLNKSTADVSQEIMDKLILLPSNSIFQLQVGDYVKSYTIKRRDYKRNRLHLVEAK